MKKWWLPAIALYAIASVGAESSAVAGRDGWLYSRSELEHLKAGELAGGGAAQKSKAVKNRDPRPAILKFNRELAARGIRLIVVPVPAKAALYPEGLEPGATVQPGAAALDRFCDELNAAGVAVLKLGPLYAARRTPLRYCRTDAHWSGDGVRQAAAEIARLIGPLPGAVSGTNPFRVKPVERVITGDLAAALGLKTKEKITLYEVSGPATVGPSPVLLMGDSHTLVFHAGGDLLAERSGLPDLLAAELGMPVELIGVRGSGATAVRINLYRKGASFLNGKKVIVWCFAGRELTEAAGGWTPVPVR